MFYVARDAFTEETPGTRAGERVALSDSRGPRGTLACESGTTSVEYRPSIAGARATPTDLSTYTPNGAGYVTRVLCNAAPTRFPTFFPGAAARGVFGSLPFSACGGQS